MTTTTATRDEYRRTDDVDLTSARAVELMADIWAGRSAGWGREHTEDRLREHRSSLTRLNAGTLTPRRVLGAGARKTAAREWLAAQVAECEAALADSGWSFTVNRRNVAYRLRLEAREAAPTPVEPVEPVEAPAEPESAPEPAQASPIPCPSCGAHDDHPGHDDACRFQVVGHRETCPHTTEPQPEPAQARQVLTVTRHTDGRVLHTGTDLPQALAALDAAGHATATLTAAPMPAAPVEPVAPPTALAGAVEPLLPIEWPTPARVVGRGRTATVDLDSLALF